MMRRMRGDLPGPQTARRLGWETAQGGSEDASFGVRGVLAPQAGRWHARRCWWPALAVVRLAEDASTLDSVGAVPAAVRSRGRPRCHNRSHSARSRQRLGRLTLCELRGLACETHVRAEASAER